MLGSTVSADDSSRPRVLNTASILLQNPFLQYDRASPLSAAALTTSVQWLRKLSDAQLSAAGCCRSLETATDTFMRAGESLSEAMRVLSTLYTAGSNNTCTIGAGAGMLAELLNEVCSFSSNLSRSLKSVFRAPLEVDAGSIFAQCLGTVAGASSAVEACSSAQDRLIRLRKGASPSALMACTDELVRTSVQSEICRFDACTSVNSAESRGRLLTGEAISGALFALHAYFRQCDASAAFHQARMDSFATAVGESRREAARRDAGWRSLRDRLETYLVHAASPAPDGPLGTDETSTAFAVEASARPGVSTSAVGRPQAAAVAVASHGQLLMDSLVQRTTAPSDAIHESVRSVLLSISAKLGSARTDFSLNLPAACWPGLTTTFGHPSPRRLIGYPASPSDIVIGGWLWRLDPSRWQSSTRAWQRQWFFVTAGRLFCVSDSAAVQPAATPQDQLAPGSVAPANSSEGGVLSSALAFASAAYASAAAGFDDRLDASAPSLQVRAVCDLATANIRFAALPAAEPVAPPPQATHTTSQQFVHGPTDRPPPAPKRNFLSRAVAAASSYIRGPGDDVGPARVRRPSDNPAAGPMGGGYPIPFALLQQEDAAAAEASIVESSGDGEAIASGAPPLSSGFEDGGELLGSAAAPVTATGRAPSPRSRPADAPMLPASYAIMNAFELRTPHETFSFAALTSLQRLHWVQTLKKVSENTITFGGNILAKSKTPLSSVADGSITANPAFAPLSLADLDDLVAKLVSYDTSTFLLPDSPGILRVSATETAVQAILAANTSCCDCGAQSPDWVSLNLGCVFCLECRYM
jgi:hypothetical protein